MAMCTLWQAARSSIISAAIQNSLSAIVPSAIKPGSQVEAPLIGKSCPSACRLVACLPDATCFILEGLGKSAPRKPFALVVGPLICTYARPR